MNCFQYQKHILHTTLDVSKQIRSDLHLESKVIGNLEESIGNLSYPFQQTK